MPFGLKCKSPKVTEKKAAKREDGASVCEFGPETSPKAGLAGDSSDTASEHGASVLLPTEYLQPRTFPKKDLGPGASLPPALVLLALAIRKCEDRQAACSPTSESVFSS